MPKTFRLKRMAKKYQKTHGGRIVGTTGRYQVKRNPRRARRNVEGGYIDKQGVFHPIRASWDYSYTRAGEGKRSAKEERSRRAFGRKNPRGLRVLAVRPIKLRGKR